MSDSEQAIKLDEIEKALRPLLKAEGFAHKKRNFRRETEPGLVQIINFQMGRADSDLQGSFAINVGIYLDEVHEILMPFRHPLKNITEADCELRGRLLALEGMVDRWLNLNESVLKVLAEIERVLYTIGLPLFQKYSSRAAILEQWKLDGCQPLQGNARTCAVAAILLAKNGDVATASATAQEWHDAASPQARPFILRVAKQIGASVNIPQPA